jgi:hypothetical protein
LAATQRDVPALVRVAKLTVTSCVNENRPRCVAVPVPFVVTTTLAGVGSESTSVPVIVPLKGTCRCASPETPGSGDVTDAPTGGPEVGLTGDAV